MTKQSEYPRIFLCHASEDKPRVKELYRQLETVGYHPWLDKFDLLPGQDWRREIRKIITDPYNIVVICLSCKSTTKRGVVQQEIKWSLDILDQQPEDTIYVIPVRLEECQPPDRLSGLHWVDLFEPDGFENLKRSLDYEFGKRQPAAEPVSGAPVEVLPTIEAVAEKPDDTDRQATLKEEQSKAGATEAANAVQVAGEVNQAKKRALGNRLKIKLKQVEALENQIAIAVDAGQKVLLEAQAEPLWNEISELEQQLAQLG